MKFETRSESYSDVILSAHTPSDAWLLQNRRDSLMMSLGIDLQDIIIQSSTYEKSYMKGTGNVSSRGAADSAFEDALSFFEIEDWDFKEYNHDDSDSSSFVSSEEDVDCLRAEACRIIENIKRIAIEFICDEHNNRSPNIGFTKDGLDTVREEGPWELDEEDSPIIWGDTLTNHQNTEQIRDIKLEVIEIYSDVSERFDSLLSNW
eukprot:CAMPEP_0198293750 /NCGR_PEP_ID=MMETSP1449-20131203/18727_1 /TAXON_ID=420275 /ORGANISM="Attheya septentrionalis, Strain CCMP2084" /LENGTH=204 /DNA_ID=CAMNT_0043993461 /DNA_START=156 /DNA_END=767 /DNA_ORIENTATION=-